MADTPPGKVVRLSQAAVNIGGVVTAICISIIVAFIVWALVFVAIPQPNVQLLTLVLGAILGNFATMVAYYFAGSVTASQSSDTSNKLASANVDLLKRAADDKSKTAPGAPQP